VRIYQIDPTKDVRWSVLVGQHPKASVFHTVGWLQALRRTYRYEPVVFTTSSPTCELKNGIVFCRINSWLTGSRLVSLPFSDHCEPLCDSAEDMNFLLRYLQTTLEHQMWRYLEIRPVNWNFNQSGDGIGFLPAAMYSQHTLDLRPELGEVFSRLNKDSVQRRIRHAHRIGLVEKCGRSEDLLREFYTLFRITRGRHRVPPPPYAWFRNLIQCQDKASEIRLAYKDKTPIAAILTLRFRDVAYFKYGCSDARFNKHGAMPWLLWNAVSSSKSSGANEFDMGRTQQGNLGLLAFKNHWVVRPKRLIYWKFPDAFSIESPDGLKLKIAKHIFSCMPNRLLTMTGRLIYRHIG